MVYLIVDDNILMIEKTHDKVNARFEVWNQILESK